MIFGKVANLIILKKMGTMSIKHGLAVRGSAQRGDVVHADVSLNYKVTIYIVGDTLRIIDIRHDGDPKAYGYCACEGHVNDIWPSVYQLEDERIDKMLRLKNIDCPIWEPICKRAREIWMEEIAGRDRLRRYESDYVMEDKA